MHYSSEAIQRMLLAAAAETKRPIHELRQELYEAVKANLGHEKRAACRVFSPQAEAEIRRMAAEDSSKTRIAERLGVTIHQLNGKLLQMGIKGLRK